jgi:hypothetical protein
MSDPATLVSGPRSLIQQSQVVVLDEVDKGFSDNNICGILAHAPGNIVNLS